MNTIKRSDQYFVVFVKYKVHSSVRCEAYSVKCTMYILQCSMYSVYCTSYSVQCAVNIIQYV